MARGKKQGSRSQAIREFLTQNPKATAKEVVEQLGQKGVKVQAGLVYMVKGSMKSKAGRKRRSEARVAGVVGNGKVADPVALIRKVKDLAIEAGGIRRLKELVVVLAE